MYKDDTEARLKAQRAQTRRIVALSAAGVVTVLALLLLFKSFRTVDNGHVGIVTSFGAVSGTVLQPGFQMVNPFTQDIHQVDLRNQVIQAEASASSKDLQNIKSTIGLTYRLDGAHVLDIFRSIGDEQLKQNIQFSLQESYKQTTGRYSAEEQLLQREAIRAGTLENVRNRLAAQHVLVTDFAIVNFDFTSDAFEQAINDKQVAAQKVLKAEQERQEAQVRNEQQIQKAEADKQSAILQAQGESEKQKLLQQSITPELLQLRYLEKWDGHLPTYSGGGSDGMLFQVPAQAPNTGTK